MSLTFPVDAKLKDGSPVQLVLAVENKGVGPLKFRLFSIHHSPFSASMLADFQHPSRNKVVLT